jgi:hypothetical protein
LPRRYSATSPAEGERITPEPDLDPVDTETPRSHPDEVMHRLPSGETVTDRPSPPTERAGSVAARRLKTRVLLTVFAVALAQQPKVRRTLQREIADYQANAEARALAAEQAAAAAAPAPAPTGQTST